MRSNKNFQLVLAMGILIFAGCTYPVNVLPTISDKTYNFPNEQIKAEIGVVFSENIQSRQLEIIPKNSLACTYPVDIGTALTTTLMKIASNRYTKASPLASVPIGNNQLDGVLFFDVLDCKIEVVYISGFFTVSADASAEFSMIIVYYDRMSKPVWRSSIITSRRAVEQGSGCILGAQAISRALEGCLNDIAIQASDKIVQIPGLR